MAFSNPNITVPVLEEVPRHCPEQIPMTGTQYQEWNSVAFDANDYFD